MQTLNQKIVIVINGKGGSGKDTVCEMTAKRFKTRIRSTITPIKEMAKLAGWKGEKDDKARKMLSDLKLLMVEYNDLPFNYGIREVEDFLQSDDEILFMHIREKEEIAKFVAASPIKAYTLLIKRMDVVFTQRDYGNVSDDGVEDYDYDFCYVGNNKTLEALEKSFNAFFDEVVIPTVKK